VFKKALKKIMDSKDKSKKFTYVDCNSGAGIGYLLFNSYVRDEKVVNSSFEVINECIRQKRDASVYLIDINKEVTSNLKENLKSYYSGYTVRCKGDSFLIKSNDFEISVVVFTESNVKASKKIRSLIGSKDVGLIYADPIGAVHNSEKCFNYFDGFDGMDLLVHYSEVNKDRIFFRDSNCRPMNDVERDAKRKYKFTTGIISKAAQKYAFFYATNTKYEVKE
jgi:hypothetical protein